MLASVRRIIRPTGLLSVGYDTEMNDTPSSLSKLRKNVKDLFHEFEALDLGSISESKVQKLLDAHGLGTDSITSAYSEPVKCFDPTAHLVGD